MARVKRQNLVDWLVNKAIDHTVDKMTSCDRSTEPEIALQDLSWLTKPLLLEDVCTPANAVDDQLIEDLHLDSPDSLEYPNRPDDEAMLDFLLHLRPFIRKHIQADPSDAPISPGPVKWGGQVGDYTLYKHPPPGQFWPCSGVFHEPLVCVSLVCRVSAQSGLSLSLQGCGAQWSSSKKAKMLL